MRRYFLVSLLVLLLLCQTLVVQAYLQAVWTFTANVFFLLLSQPSTNVCYCTPEAIVVFQFMHVILHTQQTHPCYFPFHSYNLSWHSVKWGQRQQRRVPGVFKKACIRVLWLVLTPRCNLEWYSGETISCWFGRKENGLGSALHVTPSCSVIIRSISQSLGCITVCTHDFSCSS